MYYSILCAMTKDDDRFLREWVVYHLLLGFDHVVLYDNGSRNPVRTVLRDCIDENLVTVIDFPAQNAPGLSAYAHCLKNLNGRTRWLAWIDMNEFIVPVQDNDIRTFLDRYDAYSAVGIHLMRFNAQDHMKQPGSSVIENCTESLGIDRTYRSIVRPETVLRPLSPYHCMYAQGYCVNEDQICIPHATSYPTASTIQINHYCHAAQKNPGNPARGTASEEPVQTTTDQTEEHTKNTAILRFLSLLNMFVHNSARHLAKFIQDQTFSDTEHVRSTLHDIHSLIEKGDIAAAEKRYRHIIRYVNIPQIHIFGMYIYYFKNDFVQFRKILSQGLHDFPEDSELFYQELTKFYAEITKKETAALEQFIRDTRKS